ncbi:MAG: protein kinase [Myxococcales bacterium]|nr:protein kinase [Myxococcales bacterium]
MGTVYRAKDLLSGEFVALKLLLELKARGDEVERFSREAQILSGLHHAGIVSYVAHGLSPNEQPFLAMQWLDGENLAQRLERGPLSVRDAIVLTARVADALAFAHSRGIIHRDIKPTNLFLPGGEIDRVQILDFGIARRVGAPRVVTRTGMIVGTPEYMSPEQARGASNLSPATDLFSLGCVLYECLAGEPPFVAGHIAAVLVRILFEAPVPISQRRTGISQRLAELVSRLLAKHPEQRIANAEALRNELVSLGDPLEQTLPVASASLRPGTESFAEHAPSLISIVVAAPPEAEMMQGITQAASCVQLDTTDRQSLLQALSAIGGSADYLANGMLVVRAPPLDSAQDQATIAACAALLIKERWPNAVVSLATGRGLVHGRTAAGEVVELAAQAMKRDVRPANGKPTSGVIIDSLSASLLEGRFEQALQPDGALLLQENRDADTGRLLLGKPTRCIGRDAELSMLDAQLRSCIDESEARLVLITAPPGVGKSRLRHEFLRRIEKRGESITALAGRGDMTSAGAPYGILRAALHTLCGIGGSEPLDLKRERLSGRISRHLSGEMAERAVWFMGELCNIPFPVEGRPMLRAARQDSKIMRDCIRRTFLDFLAAECGSAPVLLILDDLQWGDDQSVSLLAEALRERANVPLLILALARPEVHAVFPRLWQGQKAQEILLKGLSKKACERLIVQVLGKDVSAEVIARAIERSGGNALFLEELIRTIAAGKDIEQSDSVLAMLQARLGRLERSVGRTVRAAAVFGSTFWRGGVAGLLGIPSTAPELDEYLAALVDAEFIQPESESCLPKQSQYRFRHALVRDAAYGLLTPADLTMGHRLAGEFLDAAGETDAGVIADHFARGGERSRAARCYLLAAEAFYKRDDFNGALIRAKRGLDCEPEGELRGQLYSIQSTLQGALLHFDQMGAAADLALKMLRVGSLDWYRALGPAVFAAVMRQDTARALALASSLAETDPDADAYPEFLFAHQGILSMLVVMAPMSVLDAIRQRHMQVVAKLRVLDSAVERFLCLSRATMATFREPGPWTLLSNLQRALGLADQIGDKRMSFALRAGFAEWGWLDLGDHEGAERRLTEVAPLLEKTQEVNASGLSRYLLARTLLLSNDKAAWARAETVVAPLLEPGTHFGLFTILAKNVLAQLALLRGCPADAEAHARVVIQSLPAMPSWMAHAAPILIRALLNMGSATAAVDVASPLLDAIQTLGGFGVFEVEFRLAASEAFHDSGHRDRARIELRETLRQIQLRTDDITEPFWRDSYLGRNPACVRARQLAREWGTD